MDARSAISKKAALPPATLGVVAVIFMIGGFGPNSLLAVLAIGVLLSGTFLLWRPGESPILLFVFCFQWLQASIEVLQANWLGVAVNDLASEGGNAWLAAVLSLLGLFCLALGMRLGAGNWQSWEGTYARITASNLRISYWFRLYLGALVIATLAQSASGLISGLSQPLLALANLKWAFYWILAYATFLGEAHGFSERNRGLYAFCALGIELSVGLGGYFSDFKTPLFFTLLAALAAGVRLTTKRVLLLTSVSALTLMLAVAWSAIKVDYRKFVSGGQKAQIVTVGYVERLEALARMTSDLDRQQLSDGFEKLLNRLAFIDYFGIVLKTVPGLLPHEDGAIWLDAVSRPFMPRLLFPEKTVIDDLERTRLYTGIDLRTSGEGTSISVGYMAESYIDFGAVGMMVPIFGLGVLLGCFYRYMLKRDPTRLLGMGLATATIYVAAFLDASITKIFGGLIVAMLASYYLLILLPRYLPWMRGPQRR